MNAVSSIDEFSKILEFHVGSLGFDKFAYHLVRPPQGPRHRFYLDTYPQDWNSYYIKRDYVNTDPVVKCTVRSLIPFRWDAFFKDPNIGSGQLRVLNEARDFRINNGMTVPIHGPGRALAEFSVATEHNTAKFDELWVRQRHHIHVLSFYVHEAILRDHFSPPMHTVPQLSPREREGLLWTARGKTAWEISEILSISEETVVQYLKSAQVKFGVHKKTHAVVKAILFGYITP